MAVGTQSFVVGTGGTSREGPHGSVSGWGAVERASSLGVLPVPTLLVAIPEGISLFLPPELPRQGSDSGEPQRPGARWFP
jgi:hypothetical protein